MESNANLVPFLFIDNLYTMKKLFLLILIIFTFGCSTYKSNTNTSEYTFGVHMMNAFEGYYNLYQLDSICKADNINPNIKEWEKLSIKDYETGKDVSQYFYIRSLGEHENIYRVFFVNDSIVKITKRITK